jgi:hypothetical protein
MFDWVKQLLQKSHAPIDGGQKHIALQDELNRQANLTRFLYSSFRPMPLLVLPVSDECDQRSQKTELSPQYSELRVYLLQEGCALLSAYYPEQREIE